ncbi:hypothetical protein PROFUN_03274 [Planoprotostelium fungivorum]|uniref:DH domain-containing protein n=1 Tax=Planoprotostelium fungivorum TaxID=1890364 RepID=A0A2P6NWN1_9EUKA|nr:hypothetical protein PROFUN_03274 [Planoprotostelium fungivorum]
MGNATSQANARLRAKEIEALHKRQEAERQRIEQEEQNKRNKVWEKTIIKHLHAAARGYLGRKTYKEWKAMSVCRPRIAAEILTTEKFYVQSLRTLVDFFGIPLLSAVLIDEHDRLGLTPRSRSTSSADISPSSRLRRPTSSSYTYEDVDVATAPQVSGLTREDIRDVFSQIEVIFAYHESIYEELQTRMKDWKWTSHLGDIFINMVDFLKVHTAYVNNYPTALASLNRLKGTNPAFAEWLRKTESRPECNGLVLEDIDEIQFLIMPIQRIPRYVLLLKELLKNTPYLHLDYSNLSTALEKIKSIARMLNEKRRETEDFQHMVTLYNSLEPIQPDLCAPHRRLIRTGILLKEGATPVLLFLMNDLLLITKEKYGGKYRMVTRVNLHNETRILFMENDKMAGIENIFQVSNPNERPVTLKTRNEDEKFIWIRELQKCTNTLKAKAISFQSPRRELRRSDSASSMASFESVASPQAVQLHDVDDFHLPPALVTPLNNALNRTKSFNRK